MQLIGSRVRDARKRKGWTQDDLAKKVGVSLKSITNWELNTHPASPQNMRNLSEVLGVEIPWLLGEEKDNAGVEQHSRLGKSPKVYRLHEEVGGAGADAATREKCREHFEKFLAQCDTHSRIGWLWCELLEKFPLNKFKKD